MNPKSFSTKIWLGIICAFPPMSIDIFLVALPHLQQTLSISHLQVQLTLGVYFVSFAICLLIWGPISDAIGRKYTLIAGLMIFCFGSLGCALSLSIAPLLIGRFFQGIGAAAGTTTAYAIVKDLYPPKEATSVISLMISIIGLAPIIAPTLGTALYVFINWQAIFYFLFLYTLLLLWFVFKMQETHPNPDFKLNLLAMLNRYRPHLSNLPFLGYTLSGACNFGTMFIFVSCAPFIYLKHYQVHPFEFSLLFALNATAIILGSTLSARLQKFISSKILINIGFIVCLIPLIFVLWLWQSAIGLGLFVLCVYITSLGVWLATPNLAGLSLNSVHEHAGTASGLMSATRFTFGLIATLISGISIMTAHFILYVMLGFSVLALFFYLLARWVSRLR